MQTDYDTDDLEVRDGYVYFKEPIQDSSGNTVEKLTSGSWWYMTKDGSEDNTTIDAYGLLEKIEDRNAISVCTYNLYDIYGKYIRTETSSVPH